MCSDAFTIRATRFTGSHHRSCCVYRLFRDRSYDVYRLVIIPHLYRREPTHVMCTGFSTTFELAAAKYGFTLCDNNVKQFYGSSIFTRTKLLSLLKSMKLYAAQLLVFQHTIVVNKCCGDKTSVRRDLAQVSRNKTLGSWAVGNLLRPAGWRGPNHTDRTRRCISLPVATS